MIGQNSNIVLNNERTLASLSPTWWQYIFDKISKENIDCSSFVVCLLLAPHS
jgi:hypothetical protein